MKAYRIKFKSYIQLDTYKRLETIETAIIYKYFESGNLLYCYLDRYNLKTIAKSDIISLEEV